MTEKDVEILHEMMLAAAQKSLYDLAAKLKDARDAAKKALNDKWVNEIINKMKDENI